MEEDPFLGVKREVMQQMENVRTLRKVSVRLEESPASPFSESD